MARDYPSRPDSRRTRSSGNTQKRRSAQRPKPAARPTRTQRDKPRATPGWVWLVCGLCIGLTVAAGFYIFVRPAGAPGSQRIRIETPGPEKTDGATPSHDRQSTNDAGDSQPAAAAKPESKPRFAFYKMLPNYEVSVPEAEHAEHSSAPTTDDSQHSPAGEPEPSREAGTTGKQYVIQAGSFSTRADADKRKANLALLGLSAQIDAIHLASGKTVYRVRSDTLGSDDKVDRLVKRLHDNDIDTLVTRAR